MDMRPGVTHELTWTVTPDKTADAMGNPGVCVCATPWVIALPVGMTVRAKATLLETDGRRFLFSVDAWDAREKIAEGRHERFVLTDLAKFLERAMKKGGSA